MMWLDSALSCVVVVTYRCVQHSPVTVSNYFLYFLWQCDASILSGRITSCLQFLQLFLFIRILSQNRPSIIGTVQDLRNTFRYDLWSLTHICQSVRREQCKLFVRTIPPKFYLVLFTTTSFWNLFFPRSSVLYLTKWQRASMSRKYQKSPCINYAKLSKL